MKAKVACPCCGSTKKKLYTVPGHRELRGKTIEIYSFKYGGVTITRLVACEECGNVYDVVVAKKFITKKGKKHAGASSTKKKG